MSPTCDFGGAESSSAPTTCSADHSDQQATSAISGRLVLNEFRWSTTGLQLQPRRGQLSDPAKASVSSTTTPVPPLASARLLRQTTSTPAAATAPRIHDNAITAERPDVQRPPELNGFHTVKLGGKVSFQNYEVIKSSAGTRSSTLTPTVARSSAAASTVPYRTNWAAHTSSRADNMVVGSCTSRTTLAVDH
jgi:hypothetical protein